MIISRAGAVRIEAAALQAESRQARRQARAVLEASAVILEPAREVADQVLQAGGFAVAAPVAARFRTAESGTTGVELTVQLANPAHAALAAAAFSERCGGVGPPDAITVREVGVPLSAWPVRAALARSAPLASLQAIEPLGAPAGGCE